MNSQEKVIGILVCTSMWLMSTAAINVNGGWSPWSVHGSNCSKPCGGGEYNKFRSCSKPNPENSGSKCLKLDGSRGMHDEQPNPCNTEACSNGNFTDWTDGINCTISDVMRYALCGEGDAEAPCVGWQQIVETTTVNLWNKTTCPSPCLTVTCPEFGVCKDVSTEEEPLTECVCTMGYTLSSDKKVCVRPPPMPPTKRPIPVLPEAVKTVATVVSKTASVILIVFVGITLVLFLLLRIFTPDRVIQMNMEIALIAAHIFLMFPPTTYENPLYCRIVSICIHFCFTACFNFMMLEALHMYSMVAFIVKEDGIFTRLQNILIGWGLSFIIIIFCMSFEYDNYGGEYHCWLQMDTNLFFGQIIPILMITIVTLTLVEAAGAADYKPLIGLNQEQLLSARISQRTNLFILPFVIAHMYLGMMSEYEQSIALYGTFSALNGVTGALVFFFHCSNNQQVRDKIKGCFNYVCKKKPDEPDAPKPKPPKVKVTKPKALRD